MTNGRAVEREDPENSRRIRARSLDRDPFRELHQGQRQKSTPHKQAGHMTAPDRSFKIQPNPFAGGSRPHMNLCQTISRPEISAE